MHNIRQSPVKEIPPYYGLGILDLRSVITTLGHMVLSSIWGF